MFIKPIYHPLYWFFYIFNNKASLEHRSTKWTPCILAILLNADIYQKLVSIEHTTLRLTFVNKIKIFRIWGSLRLLLILWMIYMLGFLTNTTYYIPFATSNWKNRDGCLSKIKVKFPKTITVLFSWLLSKTLTYQLSKLTSIPV